MQVRIPHAIFNILIINVIVFLVLNLFPEYQIHFLLFKSNLFGIHDVIQTSEGAKYFYKGMVYPFGPDDFKPYQLITHFFAHISFWHILFNMVALYSLGVPVEQVMGLKRFLIFYLFSGLFAGFCIAFLDPTPEPALGASGAISGVLSAFAFLFPDAKLLVFPILIPISARKIAIGFGLFSLTMVLFFPTAMGFSHMGHLGGLIGGVIAFLVLRKVRL